MSLSQTTGGSGGAPGQGEALWFNADWVFSGRPGTKRRGATP